MADNESSALVLVVDDQKPAAELLSRIFLSNGFETLSAYNGHDALAYAQRSQPDLILLDVMMPEIDGYEVLRRLRNNPKTAQIPTILVTARVEPDDIEHGLQLGADDYIPKPIEPRELLARARSKIEAAQLRAALQRRTTDLEALLRVSEELNANLQIDELLDLLLYLLIDLLPCDMVAVYRFDENSLVTDYRARLADGSQIEEYIDPSALTHEFKQHNDTICWSNEEHRIIDNRFPYGVAAPMKLASELHGLILLMAHTSFDASGLRLLEGIARQVTLSLRNAELFELRANYAAQLKATIDLRTEELRKAQQLLIRSEKLASVGRLAAGIAHEINNPLQPILLIMEGVLEDVQLGHELDASDIEETLRSAQRIKRIVDRLLQFTRKRGSEIPDMEVLDVTSAIQNVIALSHKYFQHEHIDLDVHLSPDSYIHGNRDQLEQVFLNLMLNARAAMPSGGTLTITSFVDSSELIIKFTDTGIGIPSDLINNIFEPFVTSKEDGTGLGLFISYGIIQNHQGTIDVQSEAGNGTTMTIRLPLFEDESEPFE